MTSAAPAQLPASPTVHEAEPGAAVCLPCGRPQHWPDFVCPNPSIYVPGAPVAAGFTPPDGHRCTTHVRLLSQAEINAGGTCWWCHPNRSPENHPSRRLTLKQLNELVLPGVGERRRREA